MAMSVEQVRLIEELAANAYPAGITQFIDGWRLRFTWGVSRRITSVWPNVTMGQMPLVEKLALVEAFYNGRGFPARYQICPAGQPSHLQQTLDERGYTIEAPTHVQTANIATVLNQIETPSAQTTLHEELDEAWFSTYCAITNLTGRKAELRQQAWRTVAPQMGFALVTVAGVPAGVGLAVYERGWVGVFGMATRPVYRRQGLASAILHTLLAWGSRQGATNAYLQVMTNNAPALALYHKLGFQTLYQYHYWTQTMAD